MIIYTTVLGGSSDLEKGRGGMGVKVAPGDAEGSILTPSLVFFPAVRLEAGHVMFLP